MNRAVILKKENSLQGESFVDGPVSTRVKLGRFELNLQTGELWTSDQDGLKVLLPEQPFQILQMLIERQGKIVSREDIRRRLWSADTIVDFDHSINVAIRILRKSLGDSAEKPRYIETLARRGYRLMVETELLLTKPGVVTNQAHQQMSPADMTGRKVSHYRVLSMIGGGGMGVVYRAEDLKLGRMVALKFLPAEVATEPIALRRFQREAQTASSLNHPNICTIYEIEEHDGRPFLAMELLSGRSLNHELDRSVQKRMPISQLLTIAIQICHGLQAAHEKGIIHRDIKPANVFLTEAGAVKILDFGLAKLMEPEPGQREEPAAPVIPKPSDSPHPQNATNDVGLSTSGVRMGTAGYMSPEQVRGKKIDARADLFSFGLILYEASTGTRAFSGQTADTIYDAILNIDPPTVRALNPEIPRSLETVISRAMQKDPALRYQSAAQMLDALERIVRRDKAFHLRAGVWLGLGALAASTLFLLWTHYSSKTHFSLSPSDTVVMTVTNNTADAVLNDAVYIALLTAVEQTPYLNVLAVNKVGEALLKRSVKMDPTRITPAIARQTCLDTSSKLVIEAFISEAGNKFRIDLNGIDCRSGQTVAHVQDDAPGRDQIIHTLGVATVQLRGDLGEPKTSIARFNAPLEQATSASPDAIQYLTEGYRRHLFNDYQGALSKYMQATEVDHEFGMAYVVIAAAQSSIGNETLAASAATRGYNLRLRATLPERLHAEEMYFQYATGQLEQTAAVLSQYVQTYPFNHIAHNNLAECLSLLGRYDASRAEALEANRLLPDATSHENLMIADIFTNRLDDAKAVYSEAVARQFDDADLHEQRALVAFLQNNSRDLQEQWQWSAGKPGPDRQLLYRRASVEGYYGRFGEYRKLSAKAEVLAKAADSTFDSALYLVDGMLREAEVGNSALARQQATQISQQGQTKYSRLLLALAFARAGDPVQALKIADELGRQKPFDTLLQSYCLPVIRAAAKLDSNEPAAAIKILKDAERYDYANVPLFEILYASYLRGVAYLQLREGRLAAAEFQKLMRNPQLTGTGEIGVLSILQFARAEAILGQRETSLQSYQRFLALWNTADSDLPAYRHAKEEYASLYASRNGPGI